MQTKILLTLTHDEPLVEGDKRWIADKFPHHHVDVAMLDQVWLVAYRHKHGGDVTVCASEAAADRVVLEIVEQGIEAEVEHARQVDDLRALVAAGDAAGALKAYCEAVEYETIEVTTSLLVSA